MSITRPPIPAYHTINSRVSLTEFNQIAIDQGLYEQQVLDGTNGDKINAAAVYPLPQSATNFCQNPSFEVWSRGFGPFSANVGDYVPMADGWVLDNLLGNATATSQRELGVVDNSPTSARLSMAAGTALRQWIPNCAELMAQTVAFTLRVSGPAGAFPYIKDGVTFVTGNVSVGTGGYETLVVMRSVAYSLLFFASTGVPDILEVGMGTTAGGTWYVDNAMLARAPGSPGFLPSRKFDDAKRLASRYYFLPFTYSFKAAGAGSIAQIEIPYPIQMAGAPLSAPGFQVLGTRTNVSSCAVSSYDDVHLTVDLVAAAAGYCGIIDAQLTLDAQIY